MNNLEYIELSNAFSKFKVLASRLNFFTNELSYMQCELNKLDPCGMINNNHSKKEGE